MKKAPLLILLVLLLCASTFAQDSTQTARKVVVGITNATVTGTTLHRLAKLSGAPSKALIVATTDTDGVLGVVTSGAGIAGIATIQTGGVSKASEGGGCDFDGATTAGDYISISSTAAGKCHDTGSSTYPTSGQVVGRVLSTNVGAGTYDVLLFSGPKAVNAVAPTRTISTTSPLTGGGDLSADRTFACATCLVSGGALGTPSSGVATNLTGLPEAGLTLADNTTNDASITKHGFVPKLPNDATKFLDGTGAWTVISVPVTSVFGRTGAVVAASNDYSFAQLSGKPTTFAGYGISDTGANLATALTTALTTSKGGTGQDTSASTGVPYVSSGTWAASTAMKFDGTELALGFGSTTPPSGPMLTVASTISTSPRGIASMQFSGDTNGARLGFFKARGTVAVPTTVVTGDTLGRLMFRGYDGSNYLEMGSIESISTGTIAATRIPTQLIFSTATDAAPSVLTTALTLGANQSATFAGTVTMPTPFTLGAISVTSTGTQLNYLSAATGTTGTTSANLVFSASPTLTGTVALPTGVTVNGNAQTFPTTAATLARTDAAQTFTGVQTFVNNILASVDGTPNIGAAATTRFNIFPYSLSMNGATGTPGEFNFSTGTNRERIVSGFFQFGSGINLCWSSGDPGSLACDGSISREGVNVLRFGDGGANANGIIDTAGYRIANAATSGNYLRGNGTSFVSNTIQAGDLPTALTPTTLTIGGGTAILKHLSSTATLDFANLAAIGCEDLTITVTGAALGDTVAIGIPNGSVVANGTFTGWVSASNTVTVRFCTVVSGDPASGTFRADIWQH